MAVVRAADLWRREGGGCNDSGMAAPEGFDYAVRADGSVSISHRGHAVTTVRGGRAAAFLAEVEQDDPQQVMALLERSSARLARLPSGDKPLYHPLRREFTLTEGSSPGTRGSLGV
jgi:hypothetical protein